MSAMQRSLLQLLCISALTACATGEPVDRRPEPDGAEIARTLGCAPDEIAVCVDVDCAPADYHCADKKRALGMLGRGENL